MIPVQFTEKFILVIYLIIAVGALVLLLTRRPRKYVPPGFTPKYVRARKVVLITVFLLAAVIAGEPVITHMTYGLSPARYNVIVAPGHEEVILELEKELGGRITIMSWNGTRLTGGKGDLCVYVFSGLEEVEYRGCKANKTIVIVDNGSFIEAEAKIEAAIYLPTSGIKLLKDLKVEKPVEGGGVMVPLTKTLLVLLTLLLTLEYYLRREFDSTATVRFTGILSAPLPLIPPEYTPLVMIGIISWIRRGSKEKVRVVMLRVTRKTVGLRWEDSSLRFWFRVLEALVIYAVMVSILPAQAVLPVLVIEEYAARLRGFD